MSDLVDAELLRNLLQTKLIIFGKDNAKELRNVEGRVVFDKLAVSYDARKQTIHDLSLSIIPGQAVARQALASLRS